MKSLRVRRTRSRGSGCWLARVRTERVRQKLAERDRDELGVERAIHRRGRIQELCEYLATGATGRDGAGRSGKWIASKLVYPSATARKTAARSAHIVEL